MKKLFTSALIPTIIFSAVCASSFAQVNFISIIDSLQYSGDPGPTTVTITIENSGSAVSSAAVVGIYFSLDATINPAEDSLIWTMPFGSLGSEELVTIDTTINLCGPIVGTYPDYVFGTDFYVGYILDYNNQVAEINEADNDDVIVPQLFIGCTLGINPATVSHPIILSPNPASGILHIDAIVDHDGHVQIHDLAGKLLLEQEITSPGQLDISALPRGIYLVAIKNEDQSATQKVVKN